MNYIIFHLSIPSTENSTEHNMRNERKTMAIELSTRRYVLRCLLIGFDTIQWNCRNATEYYIKTNTGARGTQTQSLHFSYN